MGILDFVLGAGEKLFGGTKESDQERSAKLENRVRKLGLEVEALKIDVKGDTATVKGKAASQSAREKILLAVGNTNGIAKVDDRLEVVEKKKEPEAQFYTVVKGDTLSKIAKTHYGDAMKYPVIFEANKPMLTDPDKIYPGQVLRIPPKAS
ncbi:MAG TPA: peptidoglycan-binding protein LysM [Vicinamibacteria bacterium]|nr:peptidoglycan-binding protein LysM [Vicinamibacteria bacterium]